VRTPPADGARRRWALSRGGGGEVSLEVCDGDQPEESVCRRTIRSRTISAPTACGVSLEDEEALALETRSKIESFDNLPFADLESEWNIIFEEIAEGTW
jgi:hypothetical protein